MRKFTFRLLFIFSFIFSAFSAKAQLVNLNYPHNGFVTDKSSIELCWNVKAGYLYEIEIATNSNFNPVFFTSTNMAARKIIISNLNSNTTYFWRVRAISPLVTAWSSVLSFTCFKPSTISNLNLWVKADTLVLLNGNTVLTWSDLSVNQYNLTQITASKQPTFIQNFCTNKPALRFDGNDSFEIPNFSFGSSNSIFIIGKKITGATSERYISTYGNNMEICTDLIGVSGNVFSYYSTNTPSLLTVVRTPSASKMVLNDSVLNTLSASIPPLVSGTIYFGKSNFGNVGDFLNGEIAEIIISGTTLNDSIIGLTNRYLMDKYSKILTLGNDTVITNNFCPITFDPGPGFSNFMWSTGDTTSTINVNASGTYWLQAKDYFGRTKYDTITVQYPAVNQLNSQAICAGTQLNWNTGLSSPFIHHWQNNSTQNQITINTTGDYYFTITDTYGCTFQSDTASIFVDNFAIANTIGNDTSLCVGNTLQLNNNNETNLNFLWSTGSVNDTIVINNSGQYWVEVSNINNCIFRDTASIVVAGFAPQAVFSAANGCIGVATNFIDLSTAPIGETITQWQWSFGDGTNSTSQNVMHAFDSASNYQVSLKVLTQAGCGAVFNKLITIFPLPHINYTSFNLCNEKQTVFNNISNLFGGTLQSVLWNFGDPLGVGNSATTNQASHVFDLSGNYVTQLKIETSEGCVDSLQNTITIKPSPLANFASNSHCLGDSTLFSDISQNNFPWQTLSRKWFFPNGETSLLYQPKYTFDTAGLHQVSLYVQSSNGCSDTVSKSITIFNKPEASLSFEKNCTGSPTYFNDLSTCVNCQIVDYNWYLNNVLVSNVAQFNYLFTDTGSYSLKLLVTNNGGCVSTIDTAVKVSKPPVSNFTLNSYFGSPPFEPQFNNISTLASTYLWDFGDGTTSIDFNPDHLFTDTGTFHITLSAANSDNCTSSFVQLLKLQPKKIDLFLYDLESTVINGYIDVSILVFNKSTTIVTGFEATLTNNATVAIKEVYTGAMLPGEFRKIKLNSKIKQGDALNESDVICVEIIHVNEGTDMDISNNKICKALSEVEFKLLHIYPNPAKNEAFLNFISPTKEEITVEVFDVLGNKVFTTLFTSELGYNKLSIPTYSLTAGTYTCQVRYRGTKKSVLFIKSNEE